MENEREEAYSEIYAILNLLEDELADKVPQKIKDFFEQSRDKDYNPNIDAKVPLEEQNLKRKTIVLLAILNLNYWCDSEEEKQELLESFTRNSKIKEQERKALEEKYNPDNLFKKNKKVESIVEESAESLQLIEYREENFIKRILNKIMKFFRK